MRGSTALVNIYFSRIVIICAKNTFVLVGTVLEKPEFLKPSRDAQNVCAVTKGGADLKPSFSSPEPTILLVCAKDRDLWQGPSNAQAQ